MFGAKRLVVSHSLFAIALCASPTPLELHVSLAIFLHRILDLIYLPIEQQCGGRIQRISVRDTFERSAKSGVCLANFCPGLLDQLASRFLLNLGLGLCGSRNCRFELSFLEGHGCRECASKEANDWKEKRLHDGQLSFGPSSRTKKIELALVLSICSFASENREYMLQ